MFLTRIGCRVYVPHTGLNMFEVIRSTLVLACLTIVDFYIVTTAIEIVSLVAPSMLEKSYFTVFDWLIYQFLGLRRRVMMNRSDHTLFLCWAKGIQRMTRSDEQITCFITASINWDFQWSPCQCKMWLVVKYQHPNLIFLVTLYYQPWWTNTLHWR